MAHPTRVADTRNHTGEGPLWHPTEERLYWVDIPAGQLFTFDPATDEYELTYETNGDPIGGYTIEADGSLLLFTYRTVERLVPGADETSVVAEIDADTRFNDVIADPEGRVFCGTMPGTGTSEICIVSTLMALRLSSLKTLTFRTGWGFPETWRRSSLLSPRHVGSTLSITTERRENYLPSEHFVRQPKTAAYRMG